MDLDEREKEQGDKEGEEEQGRGEERKERVREDRHIAPKWQTLSVGQ